MEAEPSEHAPRIMERIDIDSLFSGLSADPSPKTPPELTEEITQVPSTIHYEVLSNDFDEAVKIFESESSSRDGFTSVSGSSATEDRYPIAWSPLLKQVHKIRSDSNRLLMTLNKTHHRMTQGEKNCKDVQKLLEEMALSEHSEVSTDTLDVALKEVNMIIKSLNLQRYNIKSEFVTLELEIEDVLTEAEKARIRLEGELSLRTDRKAHEIRQPKANSI